MRAYNVTERFAVEAVAEVLRRKKADLEKLQVSYLVDTLGDVLADYGRGAPMKGNIVERIVLQRLAQQLEAHAG